MPEPRALSRVVRALQGLRVHPQALEADLQLAIARELFAAGVPFQREYVLGPRNRIDFLVGGGIGIEVKKGKPTSDAVRAQVERYASFLTVRALVLVVERNVFEHVDEAHGKPVRYVALNKLWGLAT